LAPVPPEHVGVVIQMTAGLAAIGFGMIANGYRDAVFGGVAIWIICWVALVLADVPPRFLSGWGAQVGQELGRAIAICLFAMFGRAILQNPLVAVSAVAIIAAGVTWIVQTAPSRTATPKAPAVSKEADKYWPKDWRSMMPSNSDGPDRPIPPHLFKQPPTQP
jgi:hypothetical protein